MKTDNSFMVRMELVLEFLILEGKGISKRRKA